MDKRRKRNRDRRTEGGEQPLAPSGAVSQSNRSGGPTWLYGHHAVAAALANPERRFHRLLVSGDPPPIPPGQRIVPETATRSEIDAVLPRDAVHQGIALLADPPVEMSLEEFCAQAALAQSALAVVLDQVSDPRNVGAVMRSAAVFGVECVIMPDRHAPAATGALAKAASGALETVRLIRTTNLSRALATLKEAGFWCIGLDAAADTAIDDVNRFPKTVLVLGAEDDGLRRLTRDSCDLIARIPGSGRSSSLNVSNAAAVALYAITRKPAQ